MNIMRPGFSREKNEAPLKWNKARKYLGSAWPVPAGKQGNGGKARTARARREDKERMVEKLRWIIKNQENQILLF